MLPAGLYERNKHIGNLPDLFCILLIGEFNLLECTRRIHKITRIYSNLIRCLGCLECCLGIEMDIGRKRNQPKSP